MKICKHLNSENSYFLAKAKDFYSIEQAFSKDQEFIISVSKSPNPEVEHECLSFPDDAPIEDIELDEKCCTID